MKSIFKITFFLCLFIINISCNEEDKKNNKNNDTITNKFNEEEFFARLDQKKVAQLNEVIHGFASPVEIAATVKSQHIEFSKNYLISTSVTTNYETQIKKALAFGLFSADLGYLTIYQKTGQMVDYLLTINNLANDLRVSQFYDFQVLKKLVTSSDNMDSLLFLTVSSFHEIDAYFTVSNRSYLTVAMITGVWLESLYLLTQVSKDNATKTKNFFDKIGSQKELLIRLYEILKVYTGHPQFDFLIKEFEKLVDVYKDVKITIIQKQGRVDFIDGNYIIYPSEEANVEMTEETLNKIVQTAAEIRQNIINIK